VLQQPVLDRRGLVRGVVVQDQVELQAGRDGGVDELEEPQELLVAVAAVGLGDDRAAGQVERGEQAGRAVADVVVGHPGRGRREHRQDRGGAVEDVGSWVAYNFAANFPDATIKAAFWGPGAPDQVLRSLPVIPGPGEWGAWHFAFNGLSGLPEKLLAGRYRALVDWLIDTLSSDPNAFDETSRAIYAAAYDSPEAIRAVAGWYGTLAQDIDEAAAYPKLAMPVLVPDGNHMGISRASNEHRGINIRFVEIPGAGHYLAEERPRELVREFLAFFG
jgi:hypothetical protein